MSNFKHSSWTYEDTMLFKLLTNVYEKIEKVTYDKETKMYDLTFNITDEEVSFKVSKTIFEALEERGEGDVS